MESYPLPDSALTQTSYDLVCLGAAALDLILLTPHVPEPDEKLVVQLAGREPGGLIANTACAARRLGLRTAWSGSLGGDEAGHLLLEGFNNFNVDSSLAEIFPGQTSDFCVVMVEPDGRRTILVTPVFKEPPRLTSQVLEALGKTRWVYTLPYGLNWLNQMAEVVHAAHGRVAVDLESSSPLRGADLQQALRQVDVVFCSRDGLALIDDSYNIEAGAEQLLAGGSQMVVVTRGAAGASLFTRQGRIDQPAFSVPVADTTGAGDCFHAACLYGLSVGWGLEAVLRFAAAASAIKVQQVGARGGLPDAAQVLAFLENSKNQNR
jgi:sugar/nucleoside kinase (ribokinase family)